MLQVTAFSNPSALWFTGSAASLIVLLTSGSTFHVLTISLSVVDSMYSSLRSLSSAMNVMGTPLGLETFNTTVVSPSVGGFGVVVEVDTGVGSGVLTGGVLEHPAIVVMTNSAGIATLIRLFMCSCYIQRHSLSEVFAEYCYPSTMTDSKTTDFEARKKLMKRLWAWRNRLQLVGGIIMVPSVIAGLAMNFGWVPLFLAEPLLIAIGVAIIPLLGSMVCTITYNHTKDKSWRRNVKTSEETLTKSDTE